MLDINQVICMKKNPLMHMNADQVLQKPDPSTSQTDLATCIPLINFFHCLPHASPKTLYRGHSLFRFYLAIQVANGWISWTIKDPDWLTKALFATTSLMIIFGHQKSKKKNTHIPKKPPPKKCVG